MAGANGDQACHFHWVIHNPFLPLTRLDATFFHGTSWKVSLVPPRDHLSQAIDSWTFEFLLKCVLSEKRRRIEARNIIVNISMNNEMRDVNRVVPNHVFEIENEHTYRFLVTVDATPQWNQAHCLVIRIEMLYIYVANKEKKGHADVLMQLSEDMQELLTSEMYSDLILKSREDLTNFAVHSYIIRERWCNFFERHANEIIENTVVLNISTAVLLEILPYFYSAILDTGGWNWEEPSFMTELFQIIDRYELYHLYEVFARNDSHQLRTTRRHLAPIYRDYRLDDAYNDPLTDYPDNWEPWEVYHDTDYYLTFRIRFFLRRHAPFCLYTLKSRYRDKIHVQVSLQFRKDSLRFHDMRIPGDPVTVHRKDHTIRSYETEESGSCPLHVNSDDFRDFLDQDVPEIPGIGSVFYIRCVLHISDGTTVVEIQSEGGIELQDHVERLNVLSKHMHILLDNHADEDLHIICLGERPRPPEDLYFLHQAIFKTRVPGWRAILGEV